MTQHHKPTNKRAWDNTQYSQKPVQKRGNPPENGPEYSDTFRLRILFTVLIAFGISSWVFSLPNAQMYNNVVTHAFIGINAVLLGCIAEHFWRKYFGN